MSKETADKAPPPLITSFTVSFIDSPSQSPEGEVMQKNLTLSQEHLENKALHDGAWDQRTHMVTQGVKYLQLDPDTKRGKSLGGLEIAKVDRRARQRLSP